MSETPEPSIPPAPAPSPAFDAPASNPDRLYQTAAWVAIIAGILLIAVTILSVVCMFGWWY